MGETTDEKEKAADDGAAKTFLRMLSAVSDGELAAECTHEMSVLCKALDHVAETMNADAKGTLTLKLQFKTSPTGTVVIAGDVVTKAPKVKSHGSLFFRTRDGGLSVNNPRQQQLALKDVNVRRAPPRDVGGDEERGAPRSV